MAASLESITMQDDECTEHGSAIVRIDSKSAYRIAHFQFRSKKKLDPPEVNIIEYRLEGKEWEPFTAIAFPAEIAVKIAVAIADIAAGKKGEAPKTKSLADATMPDTDVIDKHVIPISPKRAAIVFHVREGKKKNVTLSEPKKTRAGWDSEGYMVIAEKLAFEVGAAIAKILASA